MKKEIHPQYYPSAKATCVCGNSFVVGSAKEKIEVEICSECHPFYTGQEKVLDTAGRVEKFRAKRRSAEDKKKTVKPKAKKTKTAKE
ncbi:MAG: 50S ribosomal protein L31 [Parcubacteria group bacterium]|nr:50S ribosomal protein L31 [Parcubacteria group bacterium]